VGPIAVKSPGAKKVSPGNGRLQSNKPTLRGVWLHEKYLLCDEGGEKHLEGQVLVGKYGVVVRTTGQKVS